MKCEFCETDIPAGANSCPGCGAAVKGTSIIDPGRAVAADEQHDSSVSSSSRSNSASLVLSTASVSSSSRVSVVGTNLAAVGMQDVPARLNDDTSSTFTLSVMGCGLVNVEPVEQEDPLTGLKTAEEVSVPVEKRFCQNPKCTGDPDTAVDEERTREENDGQTYYTPVKLDADHCFCPWCAAEHWFVPNVKPGDIIKQRYQVMGYIARGGFGVIVLLYDMEIKRYVAGKVIANANDPNAVKAMVEERRWLAELDHPNIVRVYDFAEYEGSQFIIMQYVGGKTLKQVLKERREKKLGPLPVKTALAILQAILSAFVYLRKKGVVYRDFKLDNMKLVEDTVMLLDLGAVTQLGNQQTTICTMGYAPPEAVIADSATGLNCFGQPPAFSFVSDLWPVVRTLVVATCDFEFRKGPYLFDVPPAKQIKAFRRYPSFHELVKRGLRHNPSERFQSPEELSAAMVGVMREAACTDYWVENKTIGAHHVDSPYFSADTYRGAGIYEWHSLPKLKPIAGDKGGSYLAGLNEPPKHELELLLKLTSNAASPSANQPAQKGTYDKSLEIPLRIAALHIELQQYQAAEEVLNGLIKRNPFEFRVTWIRMLNYLAQGNVSEARQCAEAVYGELPGEVAPKLALAYCAELEKDFETSTALYNLVTISDDTYPSAAFGLHRVVLAARQSAKPVEARDVAVEALLRIPRNSSAHSNATLQLARILTTVEPSQAEFEEAGRVLSELNIEGFDYHRVRADVLLAGARLLESRKLTVANGVQLFGKPFTESGLRFGAEAELMEAAFAVVAHDKQLAYNLTVEALEERPETAY